MQRVCAQQSRFLFPLGFLGLQDPPAGEQQRRVKPPECLERCEQHAFPSIGLLPTGTPNANALPLLGAV